LTAASSTYGHTDQETSLLKMIVKVESPHPSDRPRIVGLVNPKAVLA
jgi:hypothetical protein